jgi:hypothetical protein
VVYVREIKRFYVTDSWIRATLRQEARTKTTNLQDRQNCLSHRITFSVKSYSIRTRPVVKGVSELVILATCTSKPVFGNSEVNSKTL